MRLCNPEAFTSNNMHVVVIGFVHLDFLTGELFTKWPCDDLSALCCVHYPMDTQFNGRAFKSSTNGVFPLLPSAKRSCLLVVVTGANGFQWPVNGCERDAQYRSSVVK